MNSIGNSAASRSRVLRKRNTGKVASDAAIVCEVEVPKVYDNRKPPIRNCFVWFSATLNYDLLT